MDSHFFLNPNAKNPASAAAAAPTRGPLAFHQRLEGYAPSPLRHAPELAQQLGLGDVLLKIESQRFGLPAFKILGASWAIYRALERHIGGPFEPWQTIADLAQRLASYKSLTLAAATDGNHGRAVAHMAALLGLGANIYVPAGTAQARIDGIANEGAHVEVIHGTYDDAVARSAQEASERCLVISDTSWPGYEEVPRWVMEGYSTIFWEIDDELRKLGEEGPDLVAVQFGVGALAAAVVNHYRQPERDQPAILSVEPTSAACALESMKAGEIVTVPGPHDSIMAGLNCGRASIIAWPAVSQEIDAFIAIEDERAREAMRALAKIAVVAGETGAAGLGGLRELLMGANHADYREALGIKNQTRALVLITEGPTDPQSYARIVASLEGNAPVVAFSPRQ